MADDCIGETVEKVIANMKPKDVVLLENVRFHAEEGKRYGILQKVGKLGGYLHK